MSIADVQAALTRRRTIIREWADVDDAHWHEDDTRYALIDPILRALGWDTGDPMECHVEYPRGSGRADYALFDREGPIGKVGKPPTIIIEAKALDAGEDLDEGESQLNDYIRASPRMVQGLGVLTNGREWRLYDLSMGGRFSTKRVHTADIIDDEDSAEVLHTWLRKERWW